MTLMLQVPGIMRLKLHYDELLSSFAFKLTLRRYTVVGQPFQPAEPDPAADAAAGAGNMWTTWSTGDTYSAGAVIAVLTTFRDYPSGRGGTLHCSTQCELFVLVPDKVLLNARVCSVEWVPGGLDRPSNLW